MFLSRITKEEVLRHFNGSIYTTQNINEYIEKDVCDTYLFHTIITKDFLNHIYISEYKDFGDDDFIFSVSIFNKSGNKWHNMYLNYSDINKLFESIKAKLL